ncbi:DUF397 domain-containing protein [Streptomyces olivaceus]|uniref:DUF397 domain-containing protein n=1 Tax=Streptomyces olivaceus TaxID=47716 RepID=A0ABS7VVI6_STROV|nr:MULTISPECIES: DUF397 domain-containing protein [Streptomyces]MBZ6086858.1 DUF397 domain-containing protein [Streptomyces olivaceus]MBZ6094541.1 DUF397 domain-containing protein [Streptomyces olivaceus]MBZ6115657.1 DUF397 domain-containing protein [Streptomyces olivaceus]MBZ6149702.1 DUF397 domain-containing protein [Streptomyces olivaceus]MBZ6296286.1 DUF397 domain-containing protein [Streptomyces olivaceus]
MIGRTHWRKSSYSEGGDGNTCVEIAEIGGLVAIRDSKAPFRGTLTVPADSFTALLQSLRATTT